MKHADLIVPGGASNEVAINFIVQNLKSQLHQLGTFKNTLIDDGIYFYDIFDTHWLNLKGSAEEDSSNNPILYKSKQIIFNQNERNKFELVNLFKLLTKDFSVDLYKYDNSFIVSFLILNSMVIKRYMKSGLRMFRNHLRSLKKFWDINKILFLHFDMELDEIIKDNDIEGKDIICILVIFHYEKTNAIVMHKIEQLKQKKPELKFYVLTAFSNIKNLTDLNTQFADVKIINSLCIVNFEELITVLKSNCLTSSIDITDESFYHTKFMKLGQKYIQKLVNQKQPKD